MLDGVFDRDFWHAYTCDTQVSTRSIWSSNDADGRRLNVSKKKVAIRFTVSCISIAIRCHLFVTNANLDWCKFIACSWKNVRKFWKLDSVSHKKPNFSFRMRGGSLRWFIKFNSSSRVQGFFRRVHSSLFLGLINWVTLREKKHRKINYLNKSQKLCLMLVSNWK